MEARGIMAHVFIPNHHSMVPCHWSNTTLFQNPNGSKIFQLDPKPINPTVNSLTDVSFTIPVDAIPQVTTVKNWLLVSSSYNTSMVKLHTAD